MKKRILRCAAALLCACTVLGTGMTCYAATGKTYGTISSSRVYGVFEYPEQGHHLEVELFATIRDKDYGTSTVKKFANSSWGTLTSVSKDATAGSGYAFTNLDVYGLVDGNVNGSMTNLKP